MPLRVLIHGGMHKTGTTALQELLAANRDRLLALGFFYPGLNPQVASALNPDAPDWHPDQCAALAREAVARGATTLLLSSEAVSKRSAVHLQQLAAAFTGHDLTFLFCFRHWAHFLPSRWAQNVMRRDSHSFASYLDRVRDPAQPHIDWRFDLVMQRALASGAHVVAVSYDHATQRDGSVVPALLHALGVPRTLSDALGQGGRYNQRRDWRVLELHRLLNGVVADARKIPQDDLCRSFAESRGCREFFDLAPHIAAMAPALHAASIAMIEQHAITRPVAVADAPIDLLSPYRSHFANLHSDDVFPDGVRNQVTSTDLTWQKFVAAVPEISLA